jgi:predicted O-methyltransferase YrrM
MSLTEQNTPIDEAKLGAIMGQLVNDVGATMSTTLFTIGDKLGLYKTLAATGPATPAELAERTGTSEIYLQSWLLNQAASGYIDYDPQTERYRLAPEQAMVLADPESPLFMAGIFECVPAFNAVTPRITQAFQTGEGLAYAEHDHKMFEGVAQFSRGSIATELVPAWLAALDGVTAKLESGATVADVGCGFGLSTITMAQAFPRSRFYGYDSHAISIEKARQAAEKAGVSDRVTFEVASATAYPARRYDLITFIDSFHDMGNSVEVARHAYKTLAAGGTLMLAEPAAGDKVEENLNPIGRILAAGSIFICVPNALAQGGPALSGQVTDARLKEVVQAGGFSQFRRTLTTLFNRVIEVRA